MTSIISIFKKVLAVLTAAIIINSTVAAANPRPLTIRLKFKLETAKLAEKPPRFGDEDEQVQVLKFQPVLKAAPVETPKEIQEVKLTLVIPKKELEEPKEPEVAIKTTNGTQVIVKYDGKEKIVGLPLSRPILCSLNGKLVAPELGEINGVRYAKCPPEPPTEPEPAEPPEFYSLKINYTPSAIFAQLIYECTRPCELFDQSNGSTYAKDLEGKGSLKILVNPSTPQRPAIKTLNGNIVLAKDPYIISPPQAGATPPAGDTISPGSVTGVGFIARDPLGSGGSTLAISWTATGDDGDVGTATSYDLRYSTSAITDSNFSSATSVTDEPTPAASGSLESYTFTQGGVLTTGTTYNFALRVLDEAGNYSFNGLGSGAIVDAL